MVSRHYVVFSLAMAREHYDRIRERELERADTGWALGDPCPENDGGYLKEFVREAVWFAGGDNETISEVDNSTASWGGLKEAARLTLEDAVAIAMQVSDHEGVGPCEVRYASTGRKVGEGFVA